MKPTMNKLLVCTAYIFTAYFLNVFADLGTCTTSSITAGSDLTNILSHSSYSGFTTYSGPITNCYSVSASSGQYILATPITIQLEGRTYAYCNSLPDKSTCRSCVNDYIKFYDGTSASSTLLATFCANDTGYTVVSTNENMYITFVADASHTTNYAGFKIQVQSVYKINPPLTAAIIIAVVSIIVTTACVVGVVFVLKKYILRKGKTGDTTHLAANMSS